MLQVEVPRMAAKGNPAALIWVNGRWEKPLPVRCPPIIVKLSESNSSQNLLDIVCSVGLKNLENPEVHHGDDGNDGDEVEYRPKEPVSSYQAYVQKNSWPAIDQSHRESTPLGFDASGIHSSIWNFQLLGLQRRYKIPQDIFLWAPSRGEMAN